LRGDEVIEPIVRERRHSARPASVDLLQRGAASLRVRNPIGITLAVEPPQAGGRRDQLGTRPVTHDCESARFYGVAASAMSSALACDPVTRRAKRVR